MISPAVRASAARPAAVSGMLSESRTSFSTTARARAGIRSLAAASASALIAWTAESRRMPISSRNTMPKRARRPIAVTAIAA